MTLKKKSAIVYICVKREDEGLKRACYLSFCLRKCVCAAVGNMGTRQAMRKELIIYGNS